MQVQIQASTQQARDLLKARQFDRSYQKQVKKYVFDDLHQRYNIPKSEKFVLFIENPCNPLYGILRSKRTKLPITVDSSIIRLAPKKAKKTTR